MERTPWDPEGVEARREQDLAAAHALVPGVHVGQGEVPPVAEVQVPARVGEHDERVVLAAIARRRGGRVVEVLVFPARLPARLDLAILLAGRGELEAAIEAFERALADGPYVARTHYNYAVFLLSQERFGDALLGFQRAVELRPNYLAARLATVATLIELGEPEQARRESDRLEELAPGSNEARRAAAFFEPRPQELP